MSFDMNPLDEDPHGECRFEIERLTAENEELRRVLVQAGQLEHAYRSDMLPDEFDGMMRDVTRQIHAELKQETSE